MIPLYNPRPSTRPLPRLMPSEHVSLKRKADTDDQDPVVQDPVPVPRHSWIPPPSPQPDVWSPPKRLRLDKQSRLPQRRSPRRHPSSSALSPTTPSALFPSQRDIIQDTGVVSRKNAGPPTGSLLRVAKSLSAPNPISQGLAVALPLVPIDPNSPHIPSPHPLINRQTLKELDLEAILRNPQLRRCQHRVLRYAPPLNHLACTRP